MTHAWFSAEDREPLHESRGRPFFGMRYRPPPTIELTAHQRRALRMRETGMEFQEIGRRLGITTSTAHGLVQRAKATVLRRIAHDQQL